MARLASCLCGECKKCRGRAAAKRWRDRHPDRAKESVRAWRDRNPEWYEQNKDAERDKMRQNYQRNKPAYFDRAAQRRALKKNAAVEHVDRMVAFHNDNGICGVCGDQCDPNNFHLDHIQPLSKDGLHCYANVQPTHPECNLRKGVN